MWWGPDVPLLPIACPVMADFGLSACCCQALASMLHSIMLRGRVLVAVPIHFGGCAPGGWGFTHAISVQWGDTWGGVGGSPLAQLNFWFHPNCLLRPLRSLMDRHGVAQ